MFDGPLLETPLRMGDQIRAVIGKVMLMVRVGREVIDEVCGEVMEAIVKSTDQNIVSIITPKPYGALASPLHLAEYEIGTISVRLIVAEGLGQALRIP